MKPLVFPFCVVFACGGLIAQTNVWHPSPGHRQRPIWPGAPPEAQPVQNPESSSTTTNLIAGRPCVLVVNVSQPTLTIYAPQGTNTGAAVVVFPGGGYNCLAIDLEGTEICDWLTSRGITAVLLKYRVPTLKFVGYRESRPALQDAQRTVSLVRFHADEWHVDPQKIGVIGFSAGGHLVAATSTRFHERSYPAIDAADQESCRPDFAIALYPGHLWHPDKGFVLNPNVPVTGHTPPTFLLHAENDPVDNVNHTLVYCLALRNAGVPVEMHVYAEGGHAFGLRRTESRITRWPELVESWLQAIGVTEEHPEVHRWVAALSSNDWRERAQALEALSNSGLNARSALGLVIERLSDGEWQVRRAAARALSRRELASEQAIPSLTAALADEEWHVRQPAAAGLAALGPASAPGVPALIQALGDEEWQVRQAAAAALAAIGRASERALPVLLKALHDEEWQVRKPAAEALAAIGPSARAAVPALRDCLNDPEIQVRRAAALAIKRIDEQATN